MSFGAVPPKFDSVPGTYFGELPIVCCRTGTSRPLKGPGYPCAVIDGRENAALIQHGEERMPLIWRPISEIEPSPPVKIANPRQLPLAVLNFELMPRQQLEPGEPEAKPNDGRLMNAFGKYMAGNKAGATKTAQSMLGPKSRKDWHSLRTNRDGSWAVSLACGGRGIAIKGLHESSFRPSLPKLFQVTSGGSVMRRLKSPSAMRSILLGWRTWWGRA